MYFQNKYNGTYSSDTLPNLTHDKPYSIINVDTSKQPGSHWIAIAKYKTKYLVFDSFGRKTKTLVNSMYKKYNPIDTDYDKNQKRSENDCGQRCISFLRVFDKYGFDHAKLI
jgi:hypothetical protein